MQHMRSGLSKAPRVLALCLMPLIFMILVLVPFGSVFADGEGGVSDLSLYQRASELTREFGTALAPGSGTERMYMLEVSNENERKLLVPGNAGAFLGYAEIMSDDVGIVGWLMNSYTAASATISYDQLMNVIDLGVGAGASEKDMVRAAAKSNPFFQYAGYGEVLTEMGLIKTVRGGMGGGLPRVIGTGIVLIAYLAANVAPFLFRGALMILTTLNPFQLFGTALSGASNADLGVISGIADYVGDIYLAVQNLSMLVLLPLFLTVTILSILVIAKGSALQKFSRYAVRVFMIFAGLPLIGATYTGIVEDLDAQVSVGSEYADYLILSSYVDFENWAKYSRLAPPADANILNPRFSEDETRSLSDRSLILEINGTRAANTRAAALQDRYSATSDLSKIVKEGSKTKDAATQTMSTLEKSSFSKVYNLLTRHMSSTLYTSSDYNGEVSGQIQRIRASNPGEANDENIVKMFSLSASDSRTWTQKAFGADADWKAPIFWNGQDGDVKTSAKGLFTEGNAMNELYQFGIYNMNIYNTGDLRYDMKEGYKTDNMPAIVTKKTAPIGQDRSSTVGGLSPIAMYNFLNTTFSNTGLTVYSPEKTTSDLARDSYASVTFGGTGVSAWTRWVENLTVMLSLATLSIAFGLMMISTALTNIPRILSGVFGTALGSIAFITKLLISTAVLLVQIIGMVFLYALSENIIMTMLLNFNEIVDTGGAYFGAGVLFEFLGSFMVIVVTGAVTWFMIKNVKIFREMLEEVVSNAINRLMGALDTSTGGRGLDTAQTTGGRMGGNGKLTDAAKADDMGGFGGMMDRLQPGALVGGAAAMVGAAHDIEAKREQMMQEKDKEGGGVARNADGTPKTGLQKLKAQADARKATAKDLMGARAKDVAKGGLGIDGKSLDRELQAKERSIQVDSLEALKPKDEAGNSKNPDGSDKSTSTTGQSMDENGNVVRDANGNALDASGKPISSETGLGIMAGQRPQVGKDGTVLDADGNAYTDEMGNAFRQDEKGRLVDENGDFVALDKDGVLKPIASLPGHNGKPVSAVNEAAKLDANRFNADKFGKMKDAQAASHYGFDKAGNIVGADGTEVMARTPNGNVPLTTDRDGFITDKDGKRVPMSALTGAVDPRGFEEVVDSETGETHLKHKGDEAMKNMAMAGAVAGKNGQPQNLTALAKQSNKANALAKGANERLASLKANGASPYAIAQAERFADKANKNAESVQERFNGAMKAQGQNPQANSVRTAPVSSEQVASAARFAQTKQASLQSEVGKLNELKTSGATENVIQRQERKVDAERMEAQQAQNIARDTQVANKTGRSFNEVHQARNKAERAEQVFGKAQQALDSAVQAKAPREEIQQREQALSKASQTLTAARSDVQRVQEAPKGTPAQIDQATARHTQAQTQYAQAAARVQQLQYQGSPQAVQAAQSMERNTQRAVTQARAAKQQAEQRVEQLQASGAPRNQVVAAKRDVEKFTNQAQSAQATHAEAVHRVQQVQTQKPAPQEIQAAKQAETQAKRQLVQATQEKRTVTSPAGWNTQTAPTVQATPSVSPTKSFAALTSAGIKNYEDYSEKVTEKSNAVKAGQSQVRQARQRLKSLRESNRPPQIVREAEQQVQQLQRSVQQSESQLNELRDHAQGLLKNGSFQPMVATRPIRKNGAAIVNQMVNMGHTQAMLDRLNIQSERGTLTEEGRRQKESLTSKLGGMRRELVSAGIKEDALLDAASIQESTRHMQQSWTSFINGKSKD